MATKYYIRNEKGHLKLSMNASAAGRILEACPGFWREYAVQGKPTVSCYEFTEDQAFGVEGFKVFFWKGDVLIPVD